MKLGTRVGWLTAAFAASLFAITFGLTFRAKQSQQRWSRLISVESEAIERLEEIIRAQNGFDAHPAANYDTVEQLLESPALKAIDIAELRIRMRGFRAAPPGERNAESVRVVTEAQRLIEAHRIEIASQLVGLEREARVTMIAGLAIAWIIVMFGLAVAVTTYKRVVRPVEKLAAAADRIAEGDVNVRAPIGGDREIVRLGMAFNRMAEELQERARTDELTRLPNFRAFREHIDEEIRRAIRYGERFGVLVLDLDHFKQYNDRFGHLAGNDALQRVAATIRLAVRAVDFPARYGGEEFAVIVPLADAASLRRIAERIRVSIEALPTPAGGTRITISIGGAIHPDDGATAEALFHTADECLYEAKRLGRNCVVIGAATPIARSAG
ncbi:MAG TPA: diguanylate cyclase [Thermoanaerobaculia bacterium]|nr:diguanylate cyclase [Thermoanaerobaculia bacterium]